MDVAVDVGVDDMRGLVVVEEKVLDDDDDDEGTGQPLHGIDDSINRTA